MKKKLVLTVMLIAPLFVASNLHCVAAPPKFKKGSMYSDIEIMGSLTCDTPRLSYESSGSITTEGYLTDSDIDAGLVTSIITEIKIIDKTGFLFISIKLDRSLLEMNKFDITNLPVGDYIIESYSSTGEKVSTGEFSIVE